MQISFPLPKNAPQTVLTLIGQAVSEKKIMVIVDRRRTDDGAWPSYKLTCILKFCFIKALFNGVNMSRTCYPDEDNRPCSILLKMCQNVVRRRIKKKTAHKIKDQLNVSNRKSCHVYT